MSHQINQVPFDKIFLTGLFAGILATMVCLGYDIWFREATLYGPSDFINVSSIIFIVNILLMVAGVLYFALKSWSKRGDLLYILFFLLVIAFCIWETMGIHRFADLKLNKEFVMLLSGTILIIGVAVLCIPYIYNHKKIVDMFYEADA